MLRVSSVNSTLPTLPSHIQSRLFDILGRSVRAACVPFRKNGRAEDDAEDEDGAGMNRVNSNVLKMATYLLFTAISSAESAHVAGKSAMGPKKKGRKAADEGDEGFNWTGYREAAVEALAEVLAVDMSKLWTMGVPDEPFVNLFCRTSFQLLEQPIPGRESPLKKTLLWMISTSLRLVSQLETTVVATMAHLLNNHEHAVVAVADLCRVASRDSGSTRLGVALLRDAVRLDLTSAAVRNGNGIKHLATFVVELSAVLPSLVMAQMSVLLPLLDAEPYVLRSAIAAVIANVVAVPEASGDGGEDAETMHSKECFAKTRDSLLNVLTERSHDINSFTRSAVCRAWVSIAEKHALPLVRVHGVAALAIDRLQDKSLVVRKAAMQLLVSLLENNPFMGTLDPTLYEAKGAELEVWLADNPLPEDAAAAKASAKAATKAAAKAAARAAEGRAEAESDDDEEDDDEEEEDRVALVGDEEKAEDEALRAVRAVKARELDFFLSATAFIRLLEGVAPKLEELLRSKSSADAVEALRFFVKGAHFALPSAAAGLRSSWALVWCGEAAVRDEVLRAFLLVHVAEPGADEPSHGNALAPGKVATNLINVVASASRSEQTCLEELLRRLVEADALAPSVFAALRNCALEGKRDAQRASAMLVLAMAAGADPGVLGSDRQLLALADATLAPADQQQRDWELVRCSAMAFAKVAKARGAAPSAVHWAAAVLSHCSEVVRGGGCGDSEADNRRWFSAAEQAHAAAVQLAAAPEQLCSEMVLAMHASTLGSGGPCSAAALARLCYVLGGSALHLLVYTEAKGDALKKSFTKKGAGEGLEVELGLGAEAELEHDTRVAAMVEEDIVGQGLLAAFEPILVRLVANEQGLFGHRLLREAATLALTKFMCISAAACERHLPLLFTALAAERHPSVRGNVMVAIGDLAFRFPNALEPWTSHIYRRLRDESGHVRSQTLMVLTHLILNDMIKVKGQVAEMVLSLEDECVRTADLARLFFQELSKRGNNPVYNLMPDIISRLSQDDSVGRDAFRRVMLFLMGFITKDKHSEALVEKLCFRFPTCTSMAQTQDLAFCIAQLPLNDKAVKKLDALAKTYRNALFDDEVFKSFTSLIAKARKFAKPELKEALNELAAKINAFHNGTAGTEDGETPETAEGAPLGEADANVGAPEEGPEERAKGAKGKRTAKGLAKDKENGARRRSQVPAR